MIRPLLFSWALLFAVAAGAQDFTLRVVDDKGNPVSWAFVGIDDRPVAATDSLGEARLPVDRLPIGTRLSASMIGTTNDAATVDEAMLGRGEYTFVLRPGAFAIDAVVVTDEDPKKLFKKYTRAPFPDAAGFRGLVVEGEMEYTSESSRVVGSFTAYNARKSFLDAGFFQGSVEISTASDTTAIKRALLLTTHYVLDRGVTFLILAGKEGGASDMKYEYVGKQDGCRVFRISFVTVDGFPSQELVYADVETRRVRRFDLRTLSAPETVSEESLERGIWPEHVEISMTVERPEGGRYANFEHIARLSSKIRWVTTDGEVHPVELTLSGMVAVER